jgi:hypothetical protein
MKEEEKKFIAKEIIETKKLYLEQIEKFDSRIYFSFLSLSITLLVLHFTSNISYWWGVGFFLITTLISEPILDKRRKNVFNKLVKEIKSGRFEELK